MVSGDLRLGGGQGPDPVAGFEPLIRFRGANHAHGRWVAAVVLEILAHGPEAKLAVRLELVAQRLAVHEITRHFGQELRHQRAERLRKLPVLQPVPVQRDGGDGQAADGFKAGKLLMRSIQLGQRHAG